VVETHKLSDRKHRKALGLFRFDGVKLAAEAIARDDELTAILLRQSNAEAVAERITALAGKGLPDTARCVTVADHVFDSLTEENAPEGVICVAKLQSTVHTTWQDGEELPPLDEHIMLLESVRDPSNLGAIIRGAAALGVDRLILSADCADIYSAKTVRASMGTLFSQRIERTDKMVETIARLREGGRRVFAAALDDSAVRLGDFDVRPGDCAVIGNEGHGLSREVLAACDEKVYIPMTDRAESLNAAVAAALLMWEFGRKSR
jgi:TrmH family RNA methyltransferase